MATIGQDRVAGTVEAGAFYGYQPMALLISATGGFLEDAVSNGVITKNGFSNTVDVVESFGSIVWMGAQDDDSFACVVDEPSFNKGEDGDFAELIAAVTAVRDGSDTVTVQTATTLLGNAVLALS